MEETLNVWFVVVVGLVAGASLVSGVLAKRRLAGAMAAPIGETCIACDSTEMVERHPDAWQCSSCGYEQGEGWVRRQEQAHLERLMALSPEEARTQAHHMMRDAHLALLSADGPLANPVRIEGSGRQRREVLNPDVLDAAQDLHQGWKRVQEASLIDDDVRAALAAAGFVPTAPPPSDKGLYETYTARNAASAMRDAAHGAAQQVAATMRVLGIEP